MFSLRYMVTRCYERLSQLPRAVASTSGQIRLCTAPVLFFSLSFKCIITLRWGSGQSQSNKGTLRLACHVKTVNYPILCPTYISSSRVLISIRPIWYNAACSNPFTILSEQEKWVKMKGGGGQRGSGGRKGDRKEGRASFWRLNFNSWLDNLFRAKATP